MFRPTPNFLDRALIGRWIAGVVLGVLLGLSIGPSSPRADALPDGLRLVMVDDPACVYCRKWLKEIGPGYPLTPAGRRAPLVRRSKGDASLAGLANVQFTPTFILVRDGHEVGRFVGYAGPETFWEMLDGLLANAGDDEAPQGRPGPGGLEPRDVRLKPRGDAGAG